MAQSMQGTNRIVQYLWYENSTIPKIWQEHFLINGDSEDVKILGNRNIFQCKLFVKKAPFCDVMRNINTWRTLIGSPFQHNQPHNSLVIKNIFNCIHLTLLSTQ